MLKVNEIFGPTIQGEGKSAGKEVVFLRVALCNLHCVWCDTPYTWNFVGNKSKHPDKFHREAEVHSMSDQEVVDKIYQTAGDVRSLVISGGEPVMQCKNLTNILRALDGWWVEVETNATLIGNEEFDGLVNQYNCSPKLSNSEDPKELRIRKEALRHYASMNKSTFKFVFRNEGDLEEILDLVKTYRIVGSRVYLMPLGLNREQLELTRDGAKYWAEKFKFNYSERLHVVQFGGVRGV